MIIRKATIDDYEGLLEIYAEIDEFHRLNHPELFIHPEGISRSIDFIDDLINSNDMELFVAEEDSKIIGLAECFLVKAPDFPIVKKRQWVQLDNIVVKRDFKHQNVGSSLLNEVTQWAKSKNSDGIELKVYSFNTNTIRYYTRNGFADLAKIMFLNLDN